MLDLILKCFAIAGPYFCIDLMTGVFIRNGKIQLRGIAEVSKLIDHEFLKAKKKSFIQKFLIENINLI
jgi:hypothetical protein